MPTAAAFGQWIPDPGCCGEPSSLHKYLYAVNDPVQRIDPSGRFSTTEFLTVTAVTYFISTVTLEPVAKQCGRDVTKALKKTLDEVEFVFRRQWTRDQRFGAGVTLYDAFGIAAEGDPALFAGSAWDIEPLKELGFSDSTALADRTVVFEGKCYYGGAVNYALWGKMNRLMYDEFGMPHNTLHFALEVAGGRKIGKAWRGEHGYAMGLEEQQALAFITYGYSGLLPTGFVSPIPNTRLSTLQYRDEPIQWVWEPHRPRGGN